MTSAGPPFRLDQLAGINAFFELRVEREVHDQEWRPVADALQDDRLINNLIDQVAARLGATTRWIAASILHLGWAEHLSSIHAGSIILEGAIPDLAAANLHYRTHQGGRLEFAVEPLVAVDVTTGWQHLVDHLELLAKAIRRNVRIGRRLLVGNVASALAGSLVALDRTGHAPLDAMVRQRWAQPSDLQPYGRWMQTADGLKYARNTCCGYEQLPRGTRCGDCTLTWRTP